VSDLSQNTLSHVSHESVPGASGESDLLVALPDPDGRCSIFVLENLDLWTGPAFRAKRHLLCYLHGHHLLSLDNVNLSAYWKVKGYFANTGKIFAPRAVLQVPIPDPLFPQPWQGSF